MVENVYPYRTYFWKNFCKIAAALVLAFLTSSLQAANRDKVEKIVDETMQSMTLQEKVAQLFVIQIDRNNPEELRQLQDSLVRIGLGGIIIMRGPIEPFIERTNHLQSLSRIPLIFCTDAEWGAAMRFYEYLPYPRQYQISKIPDAEKLLYKMGQNVARELKDLNIYVNFAPVADMTYEADINGAQRCFGFGFPRVTSYADAYMRGMQDCGISACAKHFPSHGDTKIDAHVALPMFDYTRAHIDTTYLVPFKKLIADGVDFIMIGHHAITGIDSTMIPASISPKCVKDLLKRDLGYTGIVVTDALEMGGVANGRTPVEIMLAAYQAGVDLLLMPEEPLAGIQAITDSVACGAFPIADLDARVKKILTLKAERGFFKKSFKREVTDVPAKIKKARRRDARLIMKMERAISEIDPAYKGTLYDPTLVLDRGRDGK